jgi:hypothetical protein
MVVGITLCFVLLVLGLLVLALHVRVMCEEWCGLCGPEEDSSDDSRRNSASVRAVDDSTRSDHPLRGRDSGGSRGTNSNGSSSSSGSERRSKKIRGDKERREGDRPRRKGGGDESGAASRGSPVDARMIATASPVLEYPGQRPMEISVV